MEKEIKEKLKDVLGKKDFLFGGCTLDSLIRIDNKDLGNLDDYCENCVFREKLEKIVFCPVRRKYMEGPDVLL